MKFDKKKCDFLASTATGTLFYHKIMLGMDSVTLSWSKTNQVCNKNVLKRSFKNFLGGIFRYLFSPNPPPGT